MRTAVGVSSTERARVPDQVDVHASGEKKLVPLRHEPMLPPATSPVNALPEHEMRVADFVASLAELRLPPRNTYLLSRDFGDRPERTAVGFANPRFGHVR
ncbi:hypothetical protein [Micromonospora purpureochromogenes]|uniref:hypothetical protein n=1 Tax=Micromonospora purpureochromogenes TaxID=47872 RepID=UPI003F4CEBF6